MYPSPQVDFGYDVSNFRDIDPQYGTLADFDHLNVEARKRGIRVIVDFVANHTSDRHPWFVDARSSRHSLHRDWYVWSDGRGGANGKPVPPNNWVSYFGGSSWAWDPKTSQYYYHAYYKEQPDLNWRNPAVQKAMLDVMRFWLDRGVAGFRLDSIPDLLEEEKLRDEPAVKSGRIRPERRIYTTNRPEVHAIVRKMRALVDSYSGDGVLIGETSLPDIHDLDRWYGGAAHDELQLPMDTLVGYVDNLNAREFRRLLTEMYTEVHGSQPLIFFDCHDSDRSWDRYGDGKHNQEIAKLIATLLLTAKATIILYQGQEIGQVTDKPTRLEEVKDPVGKTQWPTYVGRDGERTPMQWDASNTQAGFSTNPKTWLPVSFNYQTVNVQSELQDPQSLLAWYRQLIALR
jgi:alpha-glucosidase